MKKYLSMLIVPAMLLSMTACGAAAQSSASAAASAAQSASASTASTAEASPETNAAPAAESAAETETSAAETGMTVVNPVTEYKTLDEMNAAAGTQLGLPNGMEVTNEYFSVITTDSGVIGQYEFTYEGNAYTLRCAPAIFTEDISGVYIGGDTAFGTEMPDGLETNGDETCKVARWTNINGQFTLYVADNGAMTEDDFRAIAEKFNESTNPALVGSELADYYANLEGSWQDETSQRAVLDVTAEDEAASFVVNWSSSASEYSKWEMTVTVSEDGLLYYSDCTESIVTTTEDGTESTEVVSTDGSGYFSLNTEDGKLYWDGAAEDNCKTCVFVKQETTNASDELDAFNAVLDSIYGINPGSAGSSLRAEEAAEAVSAFLDTYGADLNADAYQTMTTAWLGNQTSEIGAPKDILKEAMEEFATNSGLEQNDALTAMQDGINAAINAAE